MNRATLILNRLPQLDPRSDDELTRDLEDEFAFHLDQLERELRESGESPGEAAREARERFGDVETIRRQCATIARKEHVIMMKILTAVLGLTTLIVIIIAVVLYQNAAKFQREAEQSRMVAEQARQMAEQEARRAQAVQSFLMQHLSAIDPTRDGGELDVSELLDSAAERADATFYDQPEVRAKIREAIENARVEAQSEMNRETPPPGPMEQADRDLPGIWRQVGENDEEVDETPHATLSIVSSDDNPTDIPYGTLRHPNLTEMLRVGFAPSAVRGENRDRLILVAGGKRIQETGHWRLKDGRLLLDISPAAPDEPALQKPLVFEKLPEEQPGESDPDGDDSDD